MRRSTIDAQACAHVLAMGCGCGRVWLGQAVWCAVATAEGVVTVTVAVVALAVGVAMVVAAVGVEVAVGHLRSDR